ncbi:MAG TPA: threonine-phosphate decarboxylase CobD, partial [Gammaproteobacteria bacterium]|nr:threonine-phosphate decarboxylase CobD [Gammaproteobacteria bacterium]
MQEAARRYGIPADEWLDLSTGINPVGWPVPPLPPECWQRLPEADDGLDEAAAAYYGTDQLLAVAGSQAAIQALPRLRPPSTVAILSPAYAEHRRAWEGAGHAVRPVAAEAVAEAVPEVDVLVLVHPNNPTGATFPRERLRQWHGELAARGGWLVVDEAFMDATPEASLAPEAGREGLVVLRSLGKFFGLAGVRVGFVLAWPALRTALEAALGPWAVSHPAREVARRALADRPWQERTRARLAGEGPRLRDLLAGHGLPPAGGTTLFQWVPTHRAEAVHGALAQQGIL